MTMTGLPQGLVTADIMAVTREGDSVVTLGLLPMHNR